MSDTETAPSAPEAAPVLAAGALEDLRPLIDDQRRMLGELAELGLRAARAVVSQAEGDSPPAAQDIALAYASVSRAVRLCIMLQGKLLDARDEEKERQERFTPLYQRKARVEKVIERLADAEAEDEETADALIAEAGERLDDDDLYGDLMDRPMSEIIGHLCRDLGLNPDWSELSQELWARNELTSSGPGAPLAVVAQDQSRPPPLAGEGDPDRGGEGMPPPLPVEPTKREERRPAAAWFDGEVTVGADSS